ncbi:MAG: hypothetical protein ACRDIY_14625 [Chloroflexota bacterium]
MSEYQYYEFQAIDRPLTREEMADLRALSTRATITPTLFRNEYNWGNFRGSPETLMEKYFDAHVYDSNFGTRTLMLRLPKQLVDLQATERYCVDPCVDVRTKGEVAILELRVNDEEGGWEMDVESDAWLPGLIPLRGTIAGGDLRGLYLGWLGAAQYGYLEDEELEAPVPAGLAPLSGTLQTLAEFLRIDADLIAVAAERSAKIEETQPSRRDLAEWIAGLPGAEKDALLLRAAEQGGQHLQAELLRRFRVERGPAQSRPIDQGASARAVRDLLDAAQARAEARQRAEAELQARERARQEREAAIARAKYLDGMAGREEELWRRVETLVKVKRAAEYDQAVQYLRDLRDLAARANAISAFQARLAELRGRHTRQPSFLERLTRAGLPASP